jgi:tetratricopeptide (TPR) repeat protein
MDAGDLPAASDAYSRVLEINPQHLHANLHLAELDLLSGRPERALEGLQKVADPGWRNVGTALVEHSLKHPQKSQQALDELIESNGQFAAYQIAEIYAWRGENDRAFAWLDRAYSQYDGGLTDIKTDPFFASLHGDPRFKAFLGKMKLSG